MDIICPYQNYEWDATFAEANKSLLMDTRTIIKKLNSAVTLIRYLSDNDFHALKELIQSKIDLQKETLEAFRELGLYEICAQTEGACCTRSAFADLDISDYLGLGMHPYVASRSSTIAMQEYDKGDCLFLSEEGCTMPVRRDLCVRVSPCLDYIPLNVLYYYSQIERMNKEIQEIYHSGKQRKILHKKPVRESNSPIIEVIV
ncbi:hypothetical protein ACFL0W_05020 [Nanoarchaeota archaeon]